jgi:hypothetical protein
MEFCLDKFRSRKLPESDTIQTGAFVVGVPNRGVGGVSVDRRNEGNCVARCSTGGPYEL